MFIASGRITQVDTTLNGNPKTLASSITYLPHGGITGLAFGNGLSLSHGYDNQYRTSSLIVGSVMNRAYNYDANGNITYIDGAEVSGSETAGIYSYDQGTNLLADIWREAPVVYDYDENGNTISANNKTFAYDLSNRLITVQEGSTTLGEYVYNALNQRVKKTVQEQTTIFHYDLQGHLVAETNETGQMLAEYVYLGDQPLAMIRPGEALYHYHNDHLGTPQILTNESGAVSWKAVYTPFGEAVISIEAVENPFRFPGQYYEQETGLHYNWNRYYDPGTGRYLTPDPIGLEGGINLFIYSQSNPINVIDLIGLKVKLCKRDLNICDPSSPYCIALYLRGLLPIFYHEFISINGETFGLFTRHKKLSNRCGFEGPGTVDHNLGVDQLAEMEGYMNGSCEEIECCNEDALLDDLRREAIYTSQYFCLNPGSGVGMNCQEWANTKIKSYCESQ